MDHQYPMNVNKDSGILVQRYITKRDELLGLYEHGEINIGEFCKRFQTEADPLLKDLQHMVDALSTGLTIESIPDWIR